MSSLRPVVIDSNLAVMVVADTTRSEAAERLIDRLGREGYQLLAPRLWRYEVTSTINKYRADKLIDRDRVAVTLSTALSFAQVIDEDMALCQSALIWAERLGQWAAYDGFYLALAERLGAEFYTADERLANRAQQVGAVWVRGLGAG